METIYLDPRKYSIPVEGLGDAKRIGPIRIEDGLGYYRTSTDPENNQGLSIVNGKLRFTVDLEKPTLSGLSPYRAEVTDWKWMLNLPRGTRELLRFDYTFQSDPNNQSAISLFQSYIRMADLPGAPGFSKVAFQLEQAYPDQIKKTTRNNYPGEIQIVNQPAAVGTAYNSVRTLTGIVPQKGQTLPIEIETVHDLKENGGFLRIKIGSYEYAVNENTIFPDCLVASQPKVGLYHHGLRPDLDTAGVMRAKNIAAGHKKCVVDCGGLVILREGPGGVWPSWYRDLAGVLAERDAIIAQAIKQGVDIGYADGHAIGLSTGYQNGLNNGTEAGAAQAIAEVKNSLAPFRLLLGV